MHPLVFVGLLFCSELTSGTYLVLGTDTLHLVQPPKPLAQIGCRRAEDQQGPRKYFDMSNPGRQSCPIARPTDLPDQQR